MNKLPIDDVLPQLLKAVSTNASIILHAPPGAGKTTRVPLSLLDVIPAEAGRIIMLEPRRIAAVAAARWMASSLGEEVGQTVGYSIRFDSCVSAATRIEIVTEGILTRRMQSDPELAGVAMVVFDEFHERTVHADLGLALCLEVQQLRGDLKILIMSATLDLAPLSRLLADAPLISSEGRAFAVEVKYLGDNNALRLSQRMVAAVMQALHEAEGDILAFLPGLGEIRSCAARLTEALAGESVLICQLYGDLPIIEQQRIIRKGLQRKVVLATSIAETSLTIEGIRIVIDSGVSRRLQYDPGNGLNRLVTVRESRASAEQRAGRAGRTVPGVCYRLYSQHTLQAMTQHTPPEIYVTELSQLQLELAAWGVTNSKQLSWLDAPPDSALNAGKLLLEDLELLDETGRITKLGSEVVRLPLHPRLGSLLLRAREMGIAGVGCKVAALLSERDILCAASADTASIGRGSGIADRLEVLKNWCLSSVCTGNADVTAIKNVGRVARQLARILAVKEAGHDYICTDDNLARMMLAGYPDRLAKRRASGGGYLLASGRGAQVSCRINVGAAEYIVAPLLDAGNQAEALIHQAVEISESVIRTERSKHIRVETRVSWDEREGRVTARKLELLGNIELSAEQTTPLPTETVPAVINAVRTAGLANIGMNDAVRQLQGRLRLLRSVFKEQSWLDISDSKLSDSLEEWLAPHLEGVNSVKKLAQLDIAEILKRQLDYRQQRELDDMAPLQMMVPSGSRIRIDYSGEAPVLAVKLQELFGLAAGPTVCDGRITLLLHLLSPAGRPIQVTSDLKGFWDGSYQQVKKELKGRYPKHPWPDDPWSAVPTRRVKPRGN